MALGVLAVSALAAIAWQRTRPATMRSCTLTAAVSNPIATTPEGAVDAWWAERGPADTEYWISNGPADPYGPRATRATRADFEPINDTQWEWRYSDARAVGVSVGHAPGTGDAWTVTAVNGCTYGTA